MIYSINFLTSFFDKINEIKFTKDLIKLSNELNEIFKNSNKNIKEELFKKKIKTKEGKITFEVVLSYIFNYSFIDTTKQSIVSNYNFNNNNSIDRSTFYKK